MTVQEVKALDMVDYLSRLGHEPSRISGKSYWYLSPLREEKTASFKINRAMNRWYDFSEGKGGNLIDFGVLYYQCGVKEFLQKIGASGISPDQHLQTSNNSSPQEDRESRIQIISVHEISSYPLQRYLRTRRIAGGVAREFLKEVRYRTGDKMYYALGFKNDGGGYELRNENFKGSSSPKGITFIDNRAKDLAVFEGFFNFLTYKNMYYNQQEPARNYLVLNSISFFEKSLQKMQEHRLVHLYLDNDKTGQKCTFWALSLDREKFRDERSLYRNYNDLNDWLLHIGKSQREQFRQSP